MASFSLAALTVLELAPPEMIELAARCGYETVGLRLLPATPGGIAYRLMDDAPLLRETLARLQSTGVTVADLEVVAFRPETDVASFTPFFEAGARLGAKHILVAAYDPDLARFSDRYRQFCEAAATYGLTSDLEFMPWTSVPDLKAAMRIVGDVDHPAAGILVDALHFDRSQSSLVDLRTIPARRLHYWQLCDGPAERPATTEQLIHAAREERMFPGEGAIDLIGLTKAMPDDLTISIEVPTVQLAKTVDAETRARRALAAGKSVVERARANS
ncbi:sugar phosphate isomerase/epimerase [Bradyrhizobium sp. S3.2.6]|uniref:Sugar phosphate isomerase/epimerase n=1 Tax=Bradyrhizobium cytisi TaxID=515489 RepID=A0A5S4WPQ9_9BRAD|nr:TIM barrel protein [Bradyrhizobium cytisi]TYL83572.1 sugar phosphate isomerase/epimerase [Bradyrhizobium cytisi]